MSTIAAYDSNCFDPLCGSLLLEEEEMDHAIFSVVTAAEGNISNSPIYHCREGQTPIKSRTPAILIMDRGDFEDYHNSDPIYEDNNGVKSLL